MRRVPLYLLWCVLAAVPLTAQTVGPPPGPPSAGPRGWPALEKQLTQDHVRPGTALARLIRENQDFGS